MSSKNFPDGSTVSRDNLAESLPVNYWLLPNENHGNYFSLLLNFAKVVPSS
jgi:hypothetical protein